MQSHFSKRLFDFGPWRSLKREAYPFRDGRLDELRSQLDRLRSYSGLPLETMVQYGYRPHAFHVLRGGEIGEGALWHERGLAVDFIIDEKSQRRQLETGIATCGGFIEWHVKWHVGCAHLDMRNYLGLVNHGGSLDWKGLV